MPSMVSSPRTTLPASTLRVSASARASRIKGTGLGMAVVKAIIESHEGSVRIASRPGQGTTVIMRVPVNPL